MPVPNTMSDLSNVAGNNYPVGSEPIGNSLDNYLRAHAALIRQGNSLASASIASASTVNVANANGESVQITGTATINSLGAGFVGCKRELRFSGACTLTHSANLQLPGAEDIVTAAGNNLRFRCIANNTWVYIGGNVSPGYSPVGHTHDAGDIVSGALSPARGGTGIEGPLEPGSFLQASASGTALLQRSPSQVLSQIGAAPLSGAAFTGLVEVRSGANSTRQVVLGATTGSPWGGIAAAGNMILFSDGRNIVLEPNGYNVATGRMILRPTGNLEVSGGLYDLRGEVRRLPGRLLTGNSSVSDSDMDGVIEKNVTGNVTLTLGSGLGSVRAAVSVVNSSTSGNITISRSGTALYRNGVNANIVLGPGSSVTIIRSNTDNRWIA